MKHIFLALILAFSTLSFSQGYNIKISVKGAENDTVFLAHYFGEMQFALDTVLLDAKGKGAFTGTEALEGGIYMFYFPSLKMRSFELLMVENQNFSIETDTLDFYKHIKVDGSKENKAFYAFHNYMIKNSEKKDPLISEIKTLEKSSKRYESIKEQLIANEKEVKAYWNALTKTWDGTLFGHVVKAMIEPEIPELIIPEYVTNIDSAKQIMKYLWYKDHFFDNYDLTDNSLIRTPFLASRIERFFTKVVVQHPDSVIKEGKKLIEMARPAEDIFAHLVRYLFGYREKSKLMGMDKLFIEISESYYLSGQATWADSAFIEKIRERVLKEKPTIIGSIAPKLEKLETYEKEFISMSEITNKYTIVIFWEPNCGHCKKTVPKLYKSFQKMKTDGIDVQTIALYTMFDREPWEKFIEKEEIFDWINAYDKYYFSKFKSSYDISTTPRIFLMDKDKRILGKQLAVEQVERIVYMMEGLTPPVHEKKEKH